MYSPSRDGLRVADDSVSINSHPGNEENEGPNILFDSNDKQFKRMRVGGTPIKQQSQRLLPQINDSSSRDSFLMEDFDFGRSPPFQLESSEQKHESNQTIDLDKRNRSSTRQTSFASSRGCRNNTLLASNMKYTSDRTLARLQEPLSATKKRKDSNRSNTRSGTELPHAASKSISTPSKQSNNQSRPPNGIASALVKRMVAGSKGDHRDMITSCPISGRKPNKTRPVGMTPIRIKPRVNKEAVLATNDGYASVKQLSAWLADDPTCTKKVVAIRRGANVISKSRRFEKDLENVIIEQCDLKRGSVNRKRESFEPGRVIEEEGLVVLDADKDFRTHNRHNWGDGAQSEIMMNKHETGSSISVNNQKKWLESAFKNAKANTVVGPVEDDSRDDITSRAKKMWMERTNTRKNIKAEEKRTPAVTTDDRYSRARTARKDATPDREGANRNKHYIVEEDCTKIDFGAARKLLMDRSQKNGNEVPVPSRYNKKLGTFERDSVRRSSDASSYMNQSAWPRQQEAIHTTTEPPIPAGNAVEIHVSFTESTEHVPLTESATELTEPSISELSISVDNAAEMFTSTTESAATEEDLAEQGLYCA